MPSATAFSSSSAWRSDLCGSETCVRERSANWIRQRSSVYATPGPSHKLPPVKLFALRGAAGVEGNTEEAILGATEELLTELMDRNALKPETVVSVLLTLTP